MKMPSVFYPPVFEDPERNRQAKLPHGILGFIAISVTGLLVTVLIAVPGYLLRAVTYTTEQLLQAIYRLLHKDVNKS